MRNRYSNFLESDRLANMFGELDFTEIVSLIEKKEISEPPWWNIDPCRFACMVKSIHLGNSILKDASGFGWERPFDEEVYRRYWRSTH